MTAELWDYLRANHTGAGRAITIAALARRFGVPRREMHDLVTALVVEQGRPVATSCRPPMGVYVAATRAEKLAYAAALRRRMAAMYRRMRAFDRAPLREVMRQLELGV